MQYPGGQEFLSGFSSDSPVATPLLAEAMMAQAQLSTSSGSSDSTGSADSDEVVQASHLNLEGPEIFV